jgi:hypothetical protein
MYAAVSYEALHSYLIEGLLVRVISALAGGGWADVDEADAPAEDAREGAFVRADTVPPPATCNMDFRLIRSAAASAAPPASAVPTAEAGAAPDARAAQDARAAREAAAE